MLHRPGVLQTENAPGLSEENGIRDSPVEWPINCRLLLGDEFIMLNGDVLDDADEGGGGRVRLRP